MKKKLGKIGKIIYRFLEAVALFFGITQGISWLLDSQDKQITIFNYDSQPLIENIISNDIKLQYKDKIVDNLYYKFFTIKNTGKKEIVPNDYIENICIMLNDNSILGVQLISSSNSYIKKNIIENTYVENNKMCFPKILLNSDDYYQVNVIMKNFPKYVSVSGVISGINKIDINNTSTITYKLNHIKKHVIYLIIIVIAVIAVISFLLISSIVEKVKNKKNEKKFMEIFKCDLYISKLLSNIYFKELKTIKKNNQYTSKEIEQINKKFEKYIDIMM